MQHWTPITMEYCVQPRQLNGIHGPTQERMYRLGGVSKSVAI